MFEKSSVDCSLIIFAISETTLDFSFHSVQFHIEDYQIRNREDRGKSRGGLIEFVNKGIIVLLYYSSWASLTSTTPISLKHIVHILIQ